MSLLQIAYLILTTCIHVHASPSATLTKTIQPTGEIWLQQTGNDLNPSQATSYGTITLGQVMSIEFDFDFHGRSNDPPERAGYQENFFRIGYDTCCTEGCNGEGSSYPAMFLSRSPIGDYLDIQVSSGATCGATHYLDDYILSTTQTHHIKISFNNTQVVVDITGGGQPTYNKQWTRLPTHKNYLGDTVNVYFLSPTFYSIPYNLGWATFNNIIIKSNIFTFAPTFAPTIPTNNPTNNPSYIPTYNPTQQPTNNPTDNPSNNPTNNPIFSPSNNPTIAPVISPTILTTPAPTNNPTIGPTENPIIAPTIAPTIPPTFKPSEDPTLHPTLKPTIKLIVRDLTDNPTIQIYSTDGVQQTMETMDEMEVKTDNYSLMYFIIIISVATFVISLTMLFVIEFYVKKYKKMKQEMKNKNEQKKTSIKAKIAPINTNMAQIPTHIKLNTISTTVRRSNATLFPPIDTNVEMIIRSDTCTSGIGNPTDININAEEMHEMSFVATDDGYGNMDFELTMDKTKLNNNPISDSELLYNDPGKVHKETAHTPVGEEEV